MKKFILIFVAVTALFVTSACNSCSVNNDNGITVEDLIYNAEATADGQVEFTWPYGGYASVDGKAIVQMCNDTTAKFSNVEAITLSEALQSNDVATAQAAKEVSEMFNVRGVEGNYHLSIVGYVKWGPMLFAFDEHYPPVNDSTFVE